MFPVVPVHREHRLTLKNKAQIAILAQMFPVPGNRGHIPTESVRTSFPKRGGKRSRQSMVFDWEPGTFLIESKEYSIKQGVFFDNFVPGCSRLAAISVAIFVNFGKPLSPPTASLQWRNVRISQFGVANRNRSEKIRNRDFRGDRHVFSSNSIPTGSECSRITPRSSSPGRPPCRCFHKRTSAGWINYGRAV
jgi:hypothetical protein